jgi:hypothetical protein
VETAKEKLAKTKLPPLVAADATSKLFPVDVKAGDRALFGTRGTAVKIDATNPRS